MLPRLERVMRTAVLGLVFSCGVSLGLAQDDDISDGFGDAADGGKVHSASGFICPAKIGLFERDAVGEKDSESGADFCAYSALDGLYGTITLTAIKGPYDPKVSLASDFAEQEGIGAQNIGEATLKTPLAVYTRTYETSKLETLHYKILFSGAAVGNWAVEATIEYADPRDNAAETDFLNTVYAGALKEIAQPAPPHALAPPPPVLVPVPPTAVPSTAPKPHSGH